MSRIWNATPNARPKSVSALTANGVPPAATAPHWAEAAKSDAVFLAAIFHVGLEAGVEISQRAQLEALRRR